MGFCRFLFRIPKLYLKQIIFARQFFSPLHGNKNGYLLGAVGSSVKQISTTGYAVDRDSSNNEKVMILNKVKKDVVKDLAQQKVFAIVFIATQQFKVSTNDLIMIHKKIEANCGDMIRLEKVLAVGSRTTSFLGQPILKRELVNVQAMVMEKTKGEKKIVFKKKRRKGYKKWQGHRQDMSILKIKSIDIDPYFI